MGRWRGKGRGREEQPRSGEDSGRGTRQVTRQTLHIVYYIGVGIFCVVL